MTARGLRIVGSRALGVCRRGGIPFLTDVLPATSTVNLSAADGGAWMSQTGPIWSDRPARFYRQFSAAALPSHTELEMPSLSPTMSQGNIIEWLKKEGDRLEPGDAIATVETDKAVITWEAQEEGYIAKILVPEGTRDIEVGVPVAVMVEEEADISAFANYQPQEASAPSSPSPESTSDAPPSTTTSEPSSGASSSASSFPTHLPLQFPALSPTMSSGNIVEWTIKEGQQVSAGDVLCQVETDKSTLDWESQDEGFVAKILVPDGTSNIDVGTPVAVLVEDESLVSAFANYTAADAEGAEGEAAPEPPSPPTPAPTESPTPVPSSTPTPVTPAPPASASISMGKVHASPYARKLARESGVSLAGVTGSGPGGRIVAADIAQLITSGKAAPIAKGEPYVDIPHTQIRRITAKRLTESKQTVPHYYLTMECNMDSVAKSRQEINSWMESKGMGVKLSVNDFIVKAAALALRDVPEANSSWHDNFIRQYNTVDISIAVQTPTGLMVPIVRNADEKGLEDICGDVKSLAKKAKEGRLAPEEFTGGTFTISNLGMYGIREFCAIVNPPQACILAVGAAMPKIVSENGVFKETSSMMVTLSSDHRVVDGAVGAQWLNAFKGYIEKPSTMLMV